MSTIDLCIFFLYLITMLGIGIYFLRQNSDLEDYFVGGRQLNSIHVGLSVVATDVGGGFSIGLGGLGFSMGLAGSWLLFTGLIGAWLSAVLLIPRIKIIEDRAKLFTFPQVLGYLYNSQVAIIATAITILGYIGFTSSQLLAGAKLASATFDSITLTEALFIMGAIVIIYTAIGGIKAVIYTDTVQWMILMVGLTCIAIPFAHLAVGGFEAISRVLPAQHLDIFHVQPKQILNWAITIIPIWFVGMTLYQRIYACRDEQTAKRAWFIAGLLEYPLMAFMGVMLGLYARVAFEQHMFSGAGFMPSSTMDSELGMPLLLKHILPAGVMGLVMSAYFSAILSTADSCLMAASGSFVNDLLKPKNPRKALWLSQLMTLLIGVAALVLASKFNNVLNLMLYSYSFMVSGLLIPLLAGVFFNQRNHFAAIASMLVGGSTTVLFSIRAPFAIPFDLDANFIGIFSSLVIYLVCSQIVEPPPRTGSQSGA